MWCSHKKDGCGWRGKLGEYEQHLNLNPSPENQLTGCQFVAVACVHGCGGWFQRRHIASHQKGACPKRHYSCEYCNEYESAFEDVTKNHYPQCIKYPVTCPNKCQDAPFERQNVNNHVKDECPLTEIDCLLHYAGCEVRLPRKDMPEHMTDTITHLTLLATVTQSLLKENQELRQTTEDLKKELRQTTEDLKKENQKQKKHNKDKQKATEKEVEILRKETRQMRLAVVGFPIDFCVKYDKVKEKIHLPTFCTHSSGYNMLHPHGNGDGEGTHVSLFTQLMRGPYDDHFKWPFRGEIRVQIVNQTGDHSHVEKTIIYHNETPDTSAGKVIDKETAGGWGVHKFLALTTLEYKATKKTHYLKDGIIIVRVVKVIITQ